MDIIEGKADMDRAKLPRISALDKIIVAVAGPVFSLLLALVFACVVWAVGHPVSEADMTTVIGYVETDSPGEKAGIKAGDKILDVDGKQVTRFSGMNDSVIWNVVRSEGDTIPFVVERDGKRLRFPSCPTRRRSSGWRRKSVRQVLIYPAQTPIIEKVQPRIAGGGGRAQAPATSSGDSTARRFTTRSRWRITFEQHPHAGDDAERATRSGQRLDVPSGPPILPKEKTPRIGIDWDTAANDDRTSESDRAGLQQPDSTLNTIGAVASPKSDVKLQHLSGPVGIVRIYYLLFQSDAAGSWRSGSA